MAVPMAGVIAVAFTLLLSRRLGWRAEGARVTLLVATVLFAFAIVFPTIGALERADGWVVAAHVALALGAIALVLGVVQLQPTARARSGKGPDASPRRRREAGDRRPATSQPHAPQPGDPHSGPHGDTA